MSSVSKALKKGGVVPDLIPSCPEELNAVKVTFKTWTLEEKNMGSTVKAAASDLLTAPTVAWEAKADALYTLVKMDIDAPNRKDPKHGPWLHYLVVNIPGSKVASGELLAEYVGVGAPKGMGLHRYVYLVYQQKAKLDTKGETPMKAAGSGGAGRSKFPWVKTWLPKLEGASLVAANYFQAEYDDSVPKLYAALGK
eukprot:gb/GEZN01011372.1/.p1 GENE.gb/GEZN01011372.1/~~gb/GEZN01011372.1/.p1  ORF type:complete len:196 (-),score=36.59 gb/GEZN01011372.1/:416-1003(-)